MQRLDACWRRERPERSQAWLDALTQVRTITRGPKPARALRALGMRADLPASEPTTAGVIATLRQAGMRGRRVGVQLYGTEPNRPLMDFLLEAGASARAVAPYRYADAADDAQVLAMMARLLAGEVDAIAFTSKAQVERLFDVAERHGETAKLRSGLQCCRVAAIGPIVRSALAEHAVTVELMPEGQFYLKQLTEQLARTLGPRPP